MSRFRGQTPLVARVFSVVALIAVALAGGGLAVRLAHASSGSAPPSPSPYGRPAGNWQAISSPNPSTSVDTELKGVAANSPTDVWAVGYYAIPSTAIGRRGGPRSGGPTSVNQTLAMHWDGMQWSIIPTPSPLQSTSGLDAVAAISSNDVWAVGTSFNNTTFVESALIEHWDGTQWSISPTPSFGTDQTSLSALAAVSSTDVWAVGLDSSSATLALHWDGTSWSTISTPSPSGAYGFNAMAAVSASDLWAVGVYNAGTSDNTFADHWNGTQWNVVPMATIPPFPGSGNIGLTSMAAIASNDVWAVGSYVGLGIYEGMRLTLTEHWNGTSWTQIASPSTGTYSTVASVAARASNAVWAVGLVDLAGVSVPLTLYWNGWAWVDVPDAGAPTYSNNIAGVVVLPAAGEAWAVGSYFSGGTTWVPLTQYFGTTSPAIGPQVRGAFPRTGKQPIGPRRATPGAVSPLS